MTLREQFRQSLLIFGTLVLAMPPVLMLADWLRYGAGQ